MRIESLRFTVFSAFCCFVLTANAQQQDTVLMRIDGEPVPASEFEQVYLKNIDLVADDSQKDLEAYLELFKNYKLKIAEAKSLKYQDRPELKRELQGYRDQLADSYMTDAPVTEALVKEAYEHLVNEVRASHIMIALPESSTPEDTLQAWDKINTLRGQLLNGADFVRLAHAESEDPSVRSNAGDLGWFSAFKMVYPFEKAAYDTPVGSISPIIRTRYGYHVLKTTDKRKSKGEVEVAHIMVAPGDTLTDPEARINDIYTKLKQGESFESMAERYSDDARTAKLGGRIGRFGFGALSSPVFEAHAFALEEPNAISKPFKSQLGWHIIKLIQKYPVQSLEEIRPQLENKIKNDSRAQIVDDALMTKLDTMYSTAADTVVVKQLYGKNASRINKDAMVFRIADSIFSVKDFQNYLGENMLQPVNDAISNENNVQNWQQAFKKFKYSAFKEYYRQHLSESNPEYSQIIREYEEGILLFALMEDTIWNAAKQDSTGLQVYFDEHRQDYAQPLRYDVDLATTTDPAFAKRVRKMLMSGKNANEITNKLNTDTEVKVFFTSASLVPGDILLPKEYEAKEEISEIYTMGKEQTIVVLKKKEMGADVVRFEDVKGRVINDYQHYLEKKWLAELAHKHTVQVDQKVFEILKKELSR